MWYAIEISYLVLWWNELLDTVTCSS